MSHILRGIIYIQVITFFYLFHIIKCVHIISYNNARKKYASFMFNNENIFLYDNKRSRSYTFIKCEKTFEFILKNKNKKKIKNCIKSKPDEKEHHEIDDLDPELDNLIKDIENGKYGEESLKLFKEIESNSKAKEEEEIKRLEEQDKKIDMKNVDEVINKTDDKLKQCAMKAFYNTEINEKQNPDVKKEYDIMQKIEKTFDEIEDDNYPEDKLTITNIYDKIKTMKIDNKPKKNPFTDTAKSLLKYKGLLHMPFEKGPLLNNNTFDWRESLEYIELNIPIYDETNCEDISFHFKNDYIKLEINKGNTKELLLDNMLCGKISYPDAYWVISNEYKENKKYINLIIPKLSGYYYIWEKLLQDGKET
ncbi:hypothetical protein C923_05850 [Plasmodium falciparum UGT5.1]|uniref:HSP20-like chaperone, putative n=12 Tax=Plasmodium falciparum TaxID=5833 RepID=Q8IKB0_PLAF7|nr:HSP20-like chaperone, putative [Plasmodium falciparum 3D7]ETW39496.1 hypothetical protein PFNF135_05529 [Plasmodium falciparum NF135/5.C10]EWC73477.1 hypothetical protein C923_05850 [Plasmodium falciparum UGT5.1]KAF4329352.1 hypothetical protein CYL21_2529 [Plasmodium falciparum NF54]KNG75412.1 hypothetical protein PFMG_01596 [Plasmodium falciparum IGH-CR14]PKC49985.1 hypothetical protein CK202_0733 [Plasmodium falciparum NF54]|eukprot:XP_001348870.2 conserved Plasmodium protein, unknown function [Plasmodium falciparum 3D7]